jgi:hypothetical protein
MKFKPLSDRSIVVIVEHAGMIICDHCEWYINRKNCVEQCEDRRYVKTEIRERLTYKGGQDGKHNTV